MFSAAFSSCYIAMMNHTVLCSHLQTEATTRAFFSRIEHSPVLVPRWKWRGPRTQKMAGQNVSKPCPVSQATTKLMQRRLEQGWESAIPQCTATTFGTMSGTHFLDLLRSNINEALGLKRVQKTWSVAILYAIEVNIPFCKEDTDRRWDDSHWLVLRRVVTSHMHRCVAVWIAAHTQMGVSINGGTHSSCI